MEGSLQRKGSRKNEEIIILEDWVMGGSVLKLKVNAKMILLLGVGRCHCGGTQMNR